MLWLFVSMFFILLVAGVVAVYVAFPHRGQDVPHAPWIGEALRKGVDALPTLDNQLAQERSMPSERATESDGERRFSHR